jgi:hypothetical protein
LSTKYSSCIGGNKLAKEANILKIINIKLIVVFDGKNRYCCGSNPSIKRLGLAHFQPYHGGVL